MKINPPLAFALDWLVSAVALLNADRRFTSIACNPSAMVAKAEIETRPWGHLRWCDASGLKNIFSLCWHTDGVANTHPEATASNPGWGRVVVHPGLDAFKNTPKRWS